MTAVVLDKAATSETVRLGNYNLEARNLARGGNAATNPPAALYIRTGPDDYVIVARGVNIYFTAATEPLDNVALAKVEEGVYAEGKWVPGRRLNGDETPEWKALRFGAGNYTIQARHALPLSLTSGARTCRGRMKNQSTFPGTGP